MRKRTLIIVGALVAAVLILASGVVAGGSIVYVLSHSGSNALIDLLRSDADPILASRSSSGESGVVIAGVDDDGPAADAGVVRGDILLKIDDQAIDSGSDLVIALKGYEPGDEASLTVLHSDDERTLTITMADRNGEAYLGITLCAVGRGIPEDVEVTTPDGLIGALIVTVTPDSPADNAGLQEGDVITAVEGEDLTLESGLSDAVAAYKPGDTVTLDVTRPSSEEQAEEESLSIDVELGKNPDDATKAYLGVEYRPTVAGMTGGMLPFLEGEDGWTPLENLPNLMRQQAADVTIVKITAGSPADDAGLQAGDVITAVNGTPVTSVRDVTDIIADAKPEDRVTLTVLSDDRERDVEVTLGQHPDDASRAYLGVQLASSIRMRQFENGDEGDGRFGFPSKPNSDALYRHWAALCAGQL